MWGARQFAATAVSLLATGCATHVDVRFDAARDFSLYRTWDWLPRGRSVDAVPDAESGLEALTSRLVHRELRSRGLARVDRPVDLFVGYQLQVRRTLVTTSETGAHQLLSSHHASPSYLIQATQERTDVYESGTLRILVKDRRGREIWRGELRARHRGDFADHLPEAVSQLLGRLPLGTPAADPRAGLHPLESGPRSSGTVGP